jgi:hypothetical protein
MKKQELHSLVQECIAEVLDEKYSEFQRVDKGSKDVDAKDKGEEDVYGAGYAAGEKAAKAKYKKLAEAYKALKENIFNTPQMGGVTQSKGTAGYIDDTSKTDKAYSDMINKGMFAVEKPNGQIVKYLASEKDAQDWVAKNDSEGTMDFNIRKV